MNSQPISFLTWQHVLWTRIMTPKCENEHMGQQNTTFHNFHPDKMAKQITIFHQQPYKIGCLSASVFQSLSLGPQFLQCQVQKCRNWRKWCTPSSLNATYLFGVKGMPAPRNTFFSSAKLGCFSGRRKFNRVCYTEKRLKDMVI